MSLAARGGDRKSKLQNETLIYTPKLSDLGIDRQTSMIAQKVAALPDEQFEAVKKGVATLKQAQKKTILSMVLMALVQLVPCPRFD